MRRRSSRGGVAAAIVVAAVLSASIAHAEPPQPAPATASHYDSIELKPRSAAGTTSNGGTAVAASGAMEASRVFVALGAVIALIFAVRWAGRRFLGMGAIGAAGGGGAVRVLSRIVLSPKQHLMLVQVGKRVVLVANTGVHMNALCEISDADEVAELVGEAQTWRERSPGAAASFLSAFGRAENLYVADDAPLARGSGAADRDDDDKSVVPPTRAELAGLLERVRLMSGAFRKT